MKYRSEFKIDVRELAYEKEPEKLVEYCKKDASRGIGAELIKDIPFTLNKEKSVERNSVHYMGFMGQENAPSEVYECEFLAIASRDWEDFKKKIAPLMNMRVTPSRTETLYDLIEKLEKK